VGLAFVLVYNMRFCGQQVRAVVCHWSVVLSPMRLVSCNQQQRKRTASAVAL